MEGYKLKRIVFLVLLLTVVSFSFVSAESIKKLNYQDNVFDLVSKINLPYNDTFTLQIEITRKCGLKEATPEDNDFAINIEFKPTNKERTEIVQPLSSKFYYKKTADENSYTASFATTTASRNGYFGTGTYLVYGDDEEGYGVVEHHEPYSMGPSFAFYYRPSTEYAYYHPSKIDNDHTPEGMRARIMARKAEKEAILSSGNKPPTILRGPKSENLIFGEVLINAAETGKGVEISIPYVKDKSNVNEIKYLTVVLSPEILAEWNSIFKFEPEEARGNLPF